MILDLLANHAWYLPLHPRLKPAFAWLAAQDFAKLVDGKVAIDGENIFASIESGTTAVPAQRKFESHRRYLDIQVPISGGERMGWVPAASVQPGEQAGPDLWFHPEPKLSQQVTVTPGSFAIFAPLEAHKPCCVLADKPAPFRKVVVKVSWT
ncbi:MAG: YhcH/YjgK/YiaL family protein [Planctomycetes bacterium]|nr:YhcH/YjgK/YiaL family protein [Planctomycetota bacterium]